MFLEECTVKELKPNENWYYHAFLNNNFLSIYRNGILSPKELGKKGEGHNGKYYVCVSKRDLERLSIYRQYSGFPMFILDNLEPLETYDNPVAQMLEKTIIPYRYSPHKTEFQVYKKIDPSHIIGLRSTNLTYKNYLEDIKKIILEMQKENIDLPIYDYTYEKSGMIRELNKEKVLNSKSINY